MWTKLARVPFVWRSVIKAALFSLVLIAILFPNPVLLLKQIQHLRNPDALIQPDLPALAEINREVNQQLPTNATPRQEFKTVERYVYQKIKYQYDWSNWGNVDYWPTAEEVLARKKEDCDGRAVLAASILRSRGFKTAKLVGNINHVWVAVDKEELMGPRPEKNFRREGGKTILTPPSRQTLLEALALTSKFPVARSLLLYFVALLLLYHPCKSVAGYFAAATVGLTGFVLLLAWAGLQLSGEVQGITFNLTAGLVLMGASGLAALFMNGLLSRLSRQPMQRVLASA